MEIQTERLRLVPATKEFTSQISRAEYQIGPHIPHYLKQLDQDPTQYGWGVWFVIKKEDNKIIGDLGFKGKPISAKEVEIGCSISPSFQGKGYATEAVQGLIKWAASTGKVKKIIAQCFEDNHASIKVLTKIGMKKIAQKYNVLLWEINLEE